MNETGKLKSVLTPDELEWFKGKGIDIGCGGFPVTDDCVQFDLRDGDAAKITEFVKDEYDFVYSSHCLEDMDDPKSAIAGWWSLVKAGGRLIVVVPDEDLYEQGNVRRFNREHKHTFTIAKRSSWSRTSINVLDLIKTLTGATLEKVELQDIGYNRSRMTFASPAAVDQTTSGAMAQIMFVLKKKKR